MNEDCETTCLVGEIKHEELPNIEIDQDIQNLVSPPSSDNESLNMRTDLSHDHDYMDTECTRVKIVRTKKKDNKYKVVRLPVKSECLKDCRSQPQEPSPTSSPPSKSETLPKDGFRVSGKSLTCTVCGIPFTRLFNLKRHMKTHSDENPRPFGCSLCDQRFRQQSVLKRHMLTHTGEKPCKCPVCGVRFTQSGSLANHLRKHFGEKPFKCTHCEESFHRSADLRVHMKCHVKIKSKTHRAPKPFACTLCIASFNLADQLERHMEIHAGVKAFPCPECEKSFKESFLLKLHMRKHTDEKPHLCMKCGENFRHDNALRYHMRKHGVGENSVEEKQHHCTKCEASFTRLGNLERHMASHDANKVIYCTDCGSVFPQEIALKKHQLTYHVVPVSPTGKTGLECPKCFLNFSNPNSLRDHLGSHEPIQETCQDDQIFGCILCDATFIDMSAFVEHMKCHDQ